MIFESAWIFKVAKNCNRKFFEGPELLHIVLKVEKPQNFHTFTLNTFRYFFTGSESCPILILSRVQIQKEVIYDLKREN